MHTNLDSQMRVSTPTVFPDHRTHLAGYKIKLYVTEVARAAEMIGYSAGADGRLRHALITTARDGRCQEICTASSHRLTEQAIGQCPLSGVKRTSRRHVLMSAFDPKRTFDPDDCCRAK